VNRRGLRPPILIVVALVAGSVGMAACGGDDDEAEGPAGGETSLDLVIGDLIPLSGDFADFGPPGEKAADLAVDQINAAVAEVGADHEVTIVHEDDETQPQPAVQAARKMVEADDVSCIAGAWASANTIPVAESVTIPEGILQITISTSDEITELEDDGVVNRITPPDSFQGPALADVMEDELGTVEGKTVNIGARNDAYGTNLADAFSSAWEEKGGTVGEEVIYDPEQPSYDSEAGQIASGDPDAFVLIDFPETYNKVGPALVRTGEWDPARTWTVDGLASSELPESAGEEATEGMRGTVPGVPEGESAAKTFDELYTEAPGPGREAFDSHNFDNIVLCYLAAVAAGSTEGPAMADEVREVSGPPGEQFTFEQLPEAIEALQRGDDIDYQGASGPIDMDEAGDTTAGVYDIWRFKGGEIDTFDEVPVPEQ
jgi:ABC-type branched-subunit amino acid transport system substrate-binding protein